MVREAIADVKDVYIPSGNRELLEAAAVFYGVSNKCRITIGKDLSKYNIKTTDGGDYFASVNLSQTQSDPKYTSTLALPSYWACGDMTRSSEKYPAVYSWAVDTRYSSRKGRWMNNLCTDYEYVYEFITGAITDTPANAEKFKRLRERRYLTEDGKVNIILVKGAQQDFFAKIPKVCEEFKKKFADYALEAAMLEAKRYPSQMQELIISREAESFISMRVALMVLDILYEDGTFKPITESERVTSNLIMFSDVLP